LRDHEGEAPDRRRTGPSAAPPPRPLAQAAIVIYATLLLLLIAIPQGLTNWLKNIDPNPVQIAALEAATTIERASNRIAFSWPYHEARRIFLDATGLRDK
jgi:hypothetical protein